MMKLILYLIKLIRYGVHGFVNHYYVVVIVHFGYVLHLHLKCLISNISDIYMMIVRCSFKIHYN